MKNILPLAIITLILTACNGEKSSIPLSEALKISAYTYPESTVIPDPTDSSSDPDHSLVKLEQLDTGKEYLLPRVGYYNNINNINLLLEYDGKLEIISESKDSQLSVDEKQALWDYSGFEGRTFGYDLSINSSGWVSILPLGFCTGPHSIDDISVDPYEGFKPDSDESFLTINALDGTDRVMITAKLKIKAIAKSQALNICTIELLSYDYSDVYKLMESANN